MTTFRPSSREKIKPSDIISSFGFPQNDASIIPSSCNINRYAFELFFENAKQSELLRILSSDHIEHGFKRMAEAAQTDNLHNIILILNRIFIFAFIEILTRDKTERANKFIERQHRYTSFTPEELDQLTNIKPEMADSIPIIFDNLMSPVQIDFGLQFYAKLDQFIDETTTPAISHLLRPFLHNNISTNKFPITFSEQAFNRPIQIFGEIEKLPTFFADTPVPNISPNQYPFARYKDNSQDIPILHISRPKFIASQMPTITCLHAPRYVECSSMSLVRPEFIYSLDNQLYLCNNTKTATLLYSHIYDISSIALSECGEWALSCDIGGEIHIINTKNTTRQCKYQYIAESGKTRSCISCCCFSPKVAHQFAIGTLAGEIFVYSVSQRQPQRRLVGHLKSIVALRIHPNSEYIASLSLDQTIRAWSISQGVCVRLFKFAGKADKSIPTSLRFSNNGNWILNTASDGSVSILDIGSGKTLKAFKASSDNAVVDAVFSLNDRMIIGYDKLGNFFFWETNESYGSQIATVRIDKVRISALECLQSDEIRIIGCSKLSSK